MSLILALSDLHFDVRMNEPFNLDFCRALTESWDTFRFDAVALAGDFCESEMLPVCGKLLRGAVPDHVPILYVPGNHEFLGREFFGRLFESQARRFRHMAPSCPFSRLYAASKRGLQPGRVEGRWNALVVLRCPEGH